MALPFVIFGVHRRNIKAAIGGAETRKMTQSKLLLAVTSTGAGLDVTDKNPSASVDMGLGSNSPENGADLRGLRRRENASHPFLRAGINWE